MITDCESDFAYMIAWDEWGKLPVINLKLAYESSMTSGPDHLFEMTCLK
jgi:hypothetical protein